MCIASKRLEELNAVIENIVSDTMKLRQKQKEYDLALNDHYHKVESLKFNAAQGYYLTKQLQGIVQKRRIVKDEIHRMEILYNQITNKDLTERLKYASKNIKKARERSRQWKRGFDVDMVEFEHEILQ